MRAAPPLFQQFDLEATLFPNAGNEAGAPVGCGFIGTWRLRRDEGFKRFEHGWKSGFQGAQYALRWHDPIHDPPMLAIPPERGKSARADPARAEPIVCHTAQSVHRNGLGITYNSGFGGEPGKTLGVSATENLG